MENACYKDNLSNSYTGNPSTCKGSRISRQGIRAEERTKKKQDLPLALAFNIYSFLSLCSFCSKGNYESYIIVFWHLFLGWQWSVLCILSSGMCHCSSSYSFSFQLPLARVVQNTERTWLQHSQQVKNECHKLCLLYPSRLLSCSLSFQWTFAGWQKRMLVHRRMWLLKCNLWIINIWSTNFHYSWVILFKISNYMLDFRSFTRTLILLYWNIFSCGKSIDSFL